MIGLFGITEPKQKVYYSLFDKNIKVNWINCCFVFVRICRVINTACWFVHLVWISFAASIFIGWIISQNIWVVGKLNFFLIQDLTEHAASGFTFSLLKSLLPLQQWKSRYPPRSLQLFFTGYPSSCVQSHPWFIHSFFAFLKFGEMAVWYLRREE